MFSNFGQPTTKKSGSVIFSTCSSFFDPYVQVQDDNKELGSLAGSLAPSHHSTRLEEEAERASINTNNSNTNSLGPPRKVRSLTYEKAAP